MQLNARVYNRKTKNEEVLSKKIEISQSEAEEEDYRDMDNWELQNIWIGI